MIIQDMLIEILAIKLYEHDTEEAGLAWTKLTEDQRAVYRERIARAPSVNRLYPGQSLPISAPPSR
jgi:hypothetical protein